MSKHGWALLGALSMVMIAIAPALLLLVVPICIGLLADD
jgi:hypothetical protein